MCEWASLSRRLLTAFAVAAAVAGPRTGAAQSVDVLQRRLIAAAKRAEQLKDSLTELHQMKARDLPADSFAVGALKLRFIRTNLGESLEADLHAAAATTMATADSVFGNELPRIAGEAPILATRVHSR